LPALRQGGDNLSKRKEKIDKILQEYDAGEWIKSRGLIEELRGSGTKAQEAELDMLDGWNLQKLKDFEKACEVSESVVSNPFADDQAKSSAYSLLAIYYSKKKETESRALECARLAQELMPENATIPQNMRLNACGIAFANLGKLAEAEKILRRVMAINKSLENSADAEVARKAKHQLAKNIYNLVSLILIPTGRLDEAYNELSKNVIPRYQEVNAETDLAAAFHQLSVVCKKQGNLVSALRFEKSSLELWIKHPDDPARITKAEQNIKNIEAEMVLASVSKAQEELGVEKLTLERDKK